VAATINIPVYSDALVVLATAGVVVPLVRYLGLNPVLGYLGAGALLGPLGLGSFIDKLPILYWFTVVDAQNVSGIAQLGVVFLLFFIGLELSYDRLFAMRRLVFGLGGLQVVITASLLSFIIAGTGEAASVAIILGACLALSSTAIVLEILGEHGELMTGAGRTSFSILLAQDLAVIPILMFVSILGTHMEGSLVSNIATALGHAVAAIALIVLIGRVVLRPLFRLVGSIQSLELLTAAVLFVIIGTGVLAAVEGLSMALGAFVAGLLLAETEYRKAVEAIVEPFKGLLLGIFFFTVGMTIDVREVARDPLAVVALVFGLVALKAAIIITLSRAFDQSWHVAIETGFLLGPGGEFAFVALGLATSLGLIAPSLSSFVVAVTSLTMVFIPALSAIARYINFRIGPPKKIDPALKAVPREQHKHAIVVGYGRVGKVVASFLTEHKVPHIAADSDAASVTADRRNGHEVYFGDATNAAFMKACGITEAAAVIVTIGSESSVDAIVLSVRQLRPDVLIVARARDTEHAKHLYAIGVTEAVPETVEASLQISEAALVGLGIPAGFVISSVHEKRDLFRAELRSAAKEVVREEPQE